MLPSNGPIRSLGLAALLILALCAFKVEAQLAVYGDLPLTHLSDKGNQTSSWLYGPGVGVYYDFLRFGPLVAGADLRGNFLFADKQRYRSVLAGLRLAAKPPLLPIKPYAQASVGVGGSKYDSVSSLATHYSNKLQYQVAGGVDFTIFPHIDFRVAEVAYARLSGTSDSAASAVNLVSVTSGIVIRLP